MILYKVKPEITELGKEELNRIATDQINPFGRPKDEWFINRIEFISLSGKNIRYWFPHTSNIKYFKKIGKESYRDDSDVIYHHDNGKRIGVKTILMLEMN